VIEVPGRDRLVKRSDESFKNLIKVLREWIRDLRRVMKSCSSGTTKDVWPTGFTSGLAHTQP
jgi:hypothetical protein